MKLRFSLSVPPGEEPTVVAVSGGAPSGVASPGPSLAPPAATPPPDDAPFGLVGGSVGTRKLVAMIRRVGPSDVPFLIEGETGSGKELVARGIHDASARRDRPFVVVNCGAISPELVESELFGHEKGAFTGATAQRKGAFELAHNGTIFLDEIEELPFALQPKLLRALEQREIKRVGGNETILADVRILAATHRNLREEYREEDVPGGPVFRDRRDRRSRPSPQGPPRRHPRHRAPLPCRHGAAFRPPRHRRRSGPLPATRQRRAVSARRADQSGMPPPRGNASGDEPLMEQKPDAGGAPRTLKCPECGTMNMPTEWYCEQCGAELAAL